MSGCKIIHILVCYYNENEIYNFIKNEILKQSLIPEKIIIVNNGAKNLSMIRKLEEFDKRIYILDYNKNLGYLGAFKKVIERMDVSYFNFIILSNSDILFGNKDFYKKLCSNYSTDYINNNKTAIIAPNILSSNLKHYLNPYMVYRPSIKKLKFLKFIYSKKIVSFIYSGLHYIKRLFPTKPKGKLKQTYIYAPHGSFLIFTKNFIEKFNFSYDAFLFGEEIYIGEICRNLGLKVIFDPNLKLVHLEHTTTGKWPSGKLLEYKKESLDFLVSLFAKLEEKNTGDILKFL